MASNHSLLKTILAFALMFHCAVPRIAQAEEGTTQVRLSPEAVNTGGNKNGYAQDNLIKGDDPHFGWELGYFYVTGQSQVTEDSKGNALVLKNTGDQVTLWFHLDQDIDKLDGRDELSIAEDTDGYDERLGIEKTNFGRGCLIVKHKDSHNMKKDAGPHVDYLAALGSENADTQVELCEEGDYEVALDYEIVESHPVQPLGFSLPFDTPFDYTYTDYRISFSFSVRNADCVVYPRDVATDAELTNSSYTANGFYLDLAKSKYLEVNLKREVLSEGVDGTVLETKLNTRVDSESTKNYTDDGIYTITAHNPKTGLDTVKVIYVGKDSILKACAETGRSVDEVIEQQQAEQLIEDEAYDALIDELSEQGLYVENVQVSYLSKEYLDNLAYNSRENIYFGYRLADIAQAMDGDKYVFALDDEGKTVVRDFEEYDDTFDKITHDVAVGGGVILVGVTVSAVSATVGAPAAVTVVLVSATKGAAIGGVSGAAIGGTVAAITEMVETGDVDAAMKKGALKASQDFKWGAIVGGITGGAGKFAELKGLSMNGLTMSEAAELQKAKLPNSIIKNLHSMDEQEIYKEAGLVAKRMSNGEWGYIRDIDWSPENVQRIKDGLAPLDPTGVPYELHHVGQSPDSPLAILTKAEHMSGGHNKILHWRESSEVEHAAEWVTQKQEFWSDLLAMAERNGLV